MSKKNLLKTAVAFGVFVVLSIFLGVNFVPHIAASPSNAANSPNTSLAIRSNYSNENFPRSILPQVTYAGSDWIERHPVIDGHGFLAPLLSMYFSSIAVNQFRTPILSGYSQHIRNGFRTPPMSNYSPSISVNGFRTPPMSNYSPSISVNGFRTPPMSNYSQCTSVNGCRTDPNSKYIRPIRGPK